MKRACLLVAFLVLVTACQKKPAEPAGGATAAQPPSAAAAAAPAPAAAPDAEPKKIEITDDLVTKYLEYEKADIELVTKYVEETRKNLEAAKGDVAKTLSQIQINEKMSKDLDENRLAKRKALGLGDAEFEAVKDAAETMSVGRMMFTQLGGNIELAKMESEQQKQLAALPPAQRKEAEAEMAKMTQALKDTRDGVDVRKKYGDKSADVMLKYADVLAKQRFDAMKLMAGKK